MFNENINKIIIINISLLVRAGLVEVPKVPFHILFKIIKISNSFIFVVNKEWRLLAKIRVVLVIG